MVLRVYSDLPEPPIISGNNTAYFIYYENPYDPEKGEYHSPIVTVFFAQAIHAKLSISCSSPTSYIGFKVNVNGRLTFLNGSGISGVPILLSYSINNGESWSDITLTNTSIDGSYFVQWIPLQLVNI